MGQPDFPQLLRFSNPAARAAWAAPFPYVLRSSDRKALGPARSLHLAAQELGNASSSAPAAPAGNVRVLEAATSVLEEKLAATQLEATSAHQTRIMLEARPIARSSRRPSPVCRCHFRP